MRTLFLATLGGILIFFALGMSSCAGLSGTVVEIGDDGITITPPARPIVLPLK